MPIKLQYNNLVVCIISYSNVEYWHSICARKLHLHCLLVMSNDAGPFISVQVNPLLLLCRSFNIHKDPLPLEAQKVLPILTELQSRVQELLNEWPGHPGLQQVRIHLMLISLCRHKCFCACIHLYSPVLLLKSSC